MILNAVIREWAIWLISILANLDYGSGVQGIRMDLHNRLPGYAIRYLFKVFGVGTAVRWGLVGLHGILWRG